MQVWQSPGKSAVIYINTYQAALVQGQTKPKMSIKTLILGGAETTDIAQD
jgi:hypothetical protein